MTGALRSASRGAPGNGSANDGGRSALVDWMLELPPWLVPAAAVVLPALEASAFLGLLVPGEAALIVGGVVANGGSLPRGR